MIKGCPITSINAHINEYYESNYRPTYNDRTIGSRLWSIKRYHFQWPWTTPNPYFKLTPLFDAERLRNRPRCRRSYNGMHYK